jgi:hypothetical protein
LGIKEGGANAAVLLELDVGVVGRGEDDVEVDIAVVVSDVSASAVL